MIQDFQIQQLSSKTRELYLALLSRGFGEGDALIAMIVEVAKGNRAK